MGGRERRGAGGRELGVGGSGAVKGLAGCGMLHSAETSQRGRARSHRRNPGSGTVGSCQPRQARGSELAVAANSVSRKWMTSSTLRKLHDSNAGTPHLDHPHPPVQHRNHVRAVSCPRHHEAPMAPALDEAPLQLVHQRRRLQAARPEVRCTPSTRWTWAGNGCLEHVWDALHALNPNMVHFRCTGTTADGLPDRADDLLPEENDVVHTALKRLRPQEAYDRVFRLRRAFQVHAARNWI